MTYSVMIVDFINVYQDKEGRRVGISGSSYSDNTKRRFESKCRQLGVDEVNWKLVKTVHNGMYDRYLLEKAGIGVQ